MKRGLEPIIVSCECGATFERTEETSSRAETGGFSCPECGAGIASWDSATHPEFRELEPSGEGAPSATES